MLTRAKRRRGLNNRQMRTRRLTLELLETRIALARPPQLIGGIEVDAGAGFRALNGSIVQTTEPTVRISIPDERVGGPVRVWLDDLDQATPRVDITDLFPTLAQVGVDSAVLGLDLGAHTIEVRAGSFSAVATMLNIRDDMSVVSSPVVYPLSHDSSLGVDVEKHTLLLNFYDETPLDAISDLLHRKELAPLDIVVPMKIVRVEIPRGYSSSEFADILVSENYTYLEDAVPNFTLSLTSIDVAGENIHKLLRDTYVESDGGFKTINDKGKPREDFSQLAASRHHFFMDTFAGHRLVDAIVKTDRSASPVVVAVIDTGFGNGKINPTDIPADAIVRPTVGNLIQAKDDGDIVSTTETSLNEIADQRLHEARGHGTAVAAAIAGRGDSKNLGTGRHLSIRPFRMVSTEKDGIVDSRMSSVISALQVAAVDRDVQVVNLSLGTFPDKDTAKFRLKAANLFTNAFKVLKDAEKIVVAANGNDGRNSNLPYPANLAPGKARTKDDFLLMAVSSTGTMHPFSGPEMLALKSNFGPQTSVSAMGDEIVLPSRDGKLASFSGTSFAAPLVSGLAGEMVFLDKNSRAAPSLTPLQIIELIEATADDLGSSFEEIGVTKPNDQPNDGLDPLFGHGRINVWKALLGVANGGLASSKPGFSSLKEIAESATAWYGFKIRTNQLGATIWLDGEQLVDKGASSPSGPSISAYEGVQPHIETFRKGDRDLPLLDRGTVPVGTERGEFVTTFSIRREDLASRKNLSLRLPGQTASDPAYFNLPLDILSMRSGQVAGVTFDDFIFEVTPPDFGDAPDSTAPMADGAGTVGYPTVLRYAAGKAVENGARHLNSNFEWLGLGSSATSVSAEVNADSHSDSDGTPNIKRSGTTMVADLDRHDDGVRFFPMTYVPESKKGILEFTISVADTELGTFTGGGKPRYSDNDATSLFINAWIDWNGNGKFEEENSEHVVKGAQINPADDFKVIDSDGTKRTQIDGNSAQFSSTFKVGKMSKNSIYARVRLDYGENAGQLPKTEHKVVNTDPLLKLASGPAQYGEVEDYQISVDFGDAKDPLETTGGSYPTKQNVLASLDGARHLDTSKEWLGNTVTREFDTHGSKAADVDETPNLGADGKQEDLDLGDDTKVEIDGLLHSLKVTYTVSSAISSLGFTHAETPATSRGKGRYDSSDPRKRIYVNIWVDWNGNGSWDDAGEHVFARKPVDPATFGKDGVYTLGDKFLDVNHNGVFEPGLDSFSADDDDLAGVASKTFEETFPFSPEVPIAEKFYVRIRLTYGEPGDSPVNLEEASSVEPTRYLAGPRGAALFGEVEDIAVRTAGTIRGVKWQDFKDDGVRDMRLEPGLNGWTITLFVFSGGTFQAIATRTTAPFDFDGNGLIDSAMEHGYYEFKNLPPGTYVVAEGNVATWTQMYPSATTPGSTAIPPTMHATYGPFGHRIVLGPAETVSGKDFGNAPPKSPVTPKSGMAPLESQATAAEREATLTTSPEQSSMNLAKEFSLPAHELLFIDDVASLTNRASRTGRRIHRPVRSVGFDPIKAARIDKRLNNDFEGLIELLAHDERTMTVK